MGEGGLWVGTCTLWPQTHVAGCVCTPAFHMASRGRAGVAPLLEFEVVLPCLVLAWGPLGGAPRQVLA